jgi:hypothetical protein
MALMNLLAVKDDDPHALAKLNRTLHGAMHALNTGGYEQDLDSGMTLEHVVSRLPQRMRSTWGAKVYRMAPDRATLLDLAKWIDEMVMGEMMTRPTSSKHSSSYKEKKPKGSPFLKKPSSLFDKKPLVFHTTSPPPVHQNASASPSSPSAQSVIPPQFVKWKAALNVIILYCIGGSSSFSCEFSCVFINYSG